MACDTLDPRAFLAAPDDVARDPERLAAWAQLHAPGLLVDEWAAQRNATNRARLDALPPGAPSFPLAPARRSHGAS